MEVVNIGEGRYEPGEHVVSVAAPDSDGDASSSGAERDDSEPSSDDTGDDDADSELRLELQSAVSSRYHSTHTADLTRDDQFHATALCQFMDILNDLDEVLDKSLLACLDDAAPTLDSDDDDLICKIKSCIADSHEEPERSEAPSSLDDNAQVVTCADTRPSAPPPEEADVTRSISTRTNFTSLGRSKSLLEAAEGERGVRLERAGAGGDAARTSMRRLEPLVLPAPGEPLTLPVILFLERAGAARPASAPLALQLTASVGAPLVLGRRALLMNRALSLPAPADAAAAAAPHWPAPHSTSASSDSGDESLPPPHHHGDTSHHPDTRDRLEDMEEGSGDAWPHRMSAVLACLSCTLGVFNISRFAMFSVHFGASFIVQFLVLSLVVGVPLLTLHVCLGRVLAANALDMWRISPIFRGVGVALLLALAGHALYSAAPLAWLLVYLRDCFITSSDRYKWALPPGHTPQEGAARNETYRLEETLAAYFQSEVLQREGGGGVGGYGAVKFQAAFNVALVWALVLVGRARGTSSYGRAVFPLLLAPLTITVVLAARLLALAPRDQLAELFADTHWSEFFVNSNSWAAAAQETFLTWGLLGACVMQLAAHSSGAGGGHKSAGGLRREAATVLVVTCVVLLLAAALARAAVLVLRDAHYVYVHSSYETVKSGQFLWPLRSPTTGGVLATPVRYSGQYASLVGVTVWRAGVTGGTAVSGWSPMALHTQLVPAALAALPPGTLSPVWAVLWYLALVLLGVAQQLAVWHCVLAGVMSVARDTLRVWETTITFLSCVLGLAVGLTLCTDGGVRVVHLVDYVWVGAWWQCALQVALAAGVFVVRGRPYSADVVVRALLPPRRRASAALAALLSFTWTVVLPVLLCAICVMDFRVGQQRQLYSWRKPAGYWGVGSRQAGAALQLGVLLLAPVAALVQTWRYVTKGPPDILDRIQNLYRPHLGGAGEAPVGSAPVARAPAPPPDPPPKYTPPPSYSTATGARLLNTLRRSFRTLRRMTAGRAEPPSEDTARLPVTLSESVERDALSALEAGERQRPAPPPSPPLLPPLPGDEPRLRVRSRSSLSLTRSLLRRSFARAPPTGAGSALRSSVRRSFRYGGGGGALGGSHERLVRGAEPLSSTVPLCHVTTTTDQTDRV